ncbi:hypothetical protein SAMN05216338_1002169 [Bradyrhizobium sp. Rc2d]|nr:hypothetical protein SAMN05216338_1002169 [Bradyrhizobium sp. Rc2d]
MTVLRSAMPPSGSSPAQTTFDQDRSSDPDSSSKGCRSGWRLQQPRQVRQIVLAGPSRGFLTLRANAGPEKLLASQSSSPIVGGTCTSSRLLLERDAASPRITLRTCSDRVPQTRRPYGGYLTATVGQQRRIDWPAASSLQSCAPISNRGAANGGTDQRQRRAHHRVDERRKIGTSRRSLRKLVERRVRAVDRPVTNQLRPGTMFRLSTSSDFGTGKLHTKPRSRHCFSCE